MVIRFAWVTTILLLCSAGLVAGEKLQPNEIIQKAVKAVGGKSAIAKMKATYSEDNGIYYGMGEGLPYKGVYSFQLPDKMRMEIKGVFTIVLNGKKGWTSMMGETKAMPEKVLAVQQKDMKTHAVVALLPFINKKGFKFTPLGNVKIKGADSIGLKVTKKGYDDVKLYFDAKNFLLNKASYKSINAEQNFKEVTSDVYYSAYKKFNGMTVATKVELQLDGKRFLAMNITEFRAVPMFDAKTFNKPE